MWLAVWHLIGAQLTGDYPLQPGWLLRWKFRSNWGTVVHSLILTACAAVFLAPDLARWWWVVILFGVVHFLLDWGKLTLAPHYPAPRIVLYVQDQMQDFGAIVALAGAGHAAGLPWPRGIFHAHPTALYWLIGYLLATFFASILIFEFGRSFGREKKTVLTYRERIPGFIERGAALTAFLVGVPILAPIAFLPRLILALGGRVPREELVLGAAVVSLCGFALHTVAL
jgi:hypothetical protein